MTSLVGNYLCKDEWKWSPKHAEVFCAATWPPISRKPSIPSFTQVPELSSSLRIFSLTSSSHCCRICSASSLVQFSSRMLSMASSLSPGSSVPVLDQGESSVGDGGEAVKGKEEETSAGASAELDLHDLGCKRCCATLSESTELDVAKHDQKEGLERTHHSKTTSLFA